MKRKIPVKTALITALAVIIVAAAVIFLPRILSAAGYVLWLLLPFIAAYLVSLAVNPMADGLRKRFHLPRGVSAVLVIVLTVGVLGGIVTGALWKIIDEVRSVYENLPTIYDNIRTVWYSISVKTADIMYVLPDNMQNIANDISNEFFDWLAEIATNAELVRSAGNAAKKLPNVFISVIVFILSLYFMVADSASVSKAVKKPFSAAFIERAEAFRKEIKKYAGGYIKAQLIIMCISFTILLIGLSIIGADYALVIALATAIVDALPFFGSGTVLVPWAVISFIMGDFVRGAGLLVIYLTVLLMRQFIEPKIVSKNIGMHPIMTLMAMYVGYRTMSVGGMILGPLVLVILVSLYRTGIFNNLIIKIKGLVFAFWNELKKIKNLFDNEGE